LFTIQSLEKDEWGVLCGVKPREGGELSRGGEKTLRCEWRVA